MNKTMKIVSILLIAILVAFTVSSVVFASGDISDVFGQIETGKEQINATNSDISEFGGRIVGTVQVVGIVVAVVILLVIGIKYLIGSASEKAEYKKTMIPYIVGAVLIFASTTVVNIVYNLASGLEKSNT